MSIAILGLSPKRSQSWTRSLSESIHVYVDRSANFQRELSRLPRSRSAKNVHESSHTGVLECFTGTSAPAPCLTHHVHGSSGSKEFDVFSKLGQRRIQCSRDMTRSKFVSLPHVNDTRRRGQETMKFIDGDFSHASSVPNIAVLQRDRQSC